MTFRIAKSVIDGLPYDFAEQVKEFLRLKEEHRFTGDAAPRADFIVEAAIRRVQYPIEDQKADDFVIDYEVVDDTPPPPPLPTLAERKIALLAQLRQAEVDALTAVLSPGRRRLLDVEVSAVTPNEDDRTAEDRAMLAERERVIVSDRDVRRKFAMAEIEIEEIADEAAVDAWHQSMAAVTGEPT